MLVGLANTNWVSKTENGTFSENDDESISDGKLDSRRDSHGRFL